MRKQCETGIKIKTSYRTADDWIWRCQRKDGHTKDHLFLIEKDCLTK